MIDIANIPPYALDLFRRGYIEAGYFTEGDDSELQGDLDPAAFKRVSADCATFVRDNWPQLVEAAERFGYTWERAGADFWFTRNGHGVGYWDRPELDAGGLGNLLSAACRDHPAEFYLGDDGRVHYASSWPASLAP